VREQFLRRLGPQTSRVEHRLHLAGIAGERNRPLEGHLGAQVRKFDLTAEIECRSWVAAGERGKRSAEHVVAFELDVAEADELSEERIGAHEPVERLAETVLVILIETVEAVDRRL
jgi:hypothetical protein